jgi:hypothetical protein
MTARELRIGNAIWFDRREKVKWVNARVIADIESQNQPLLYSPIPITEEWLVKSGFANKVKDEYSLEIESEYGAMLLYTDGELWLVDCDGGRVGKEIKYVHHLQNIYFALTGTELELKELV